MPKKNEPKNLTGKEKDKGAADKTISKKTCSKAKFVTSIIHLSMLWSEL